MIVLLLFVFCRFGDWCLVFGLVRCVMILVFACHLCVRCCMCLCFVLVSLFWWCSVCVVSACVLWFVFVL